MRSILKYCQYCGTSSYINSSHECSVTESDHSVNENDTEELPKAKSTKFDIYSMNNTDYSYISEDEDPIEIREYEKEKHMIIKMSPVEAWYKFAVGLALYICSAFASLIGLSIGYIMYLAYWK